MPLFPKLTIQQAFEKEHHSVSPQRPTGKHRTTPFVQSRVAPPGPLRLLWRIVAADGSQNPSKSKAVAVLRFQGEGVGRRTVRTKATPGRSYYCHADPGAHEVPCWAASVSCHLGVIKDA
jgi:hypothetical protein